MAETVDLIASFTCVKDGRAAALAMLSTYARHVRSSPGTLRFEPYSDTAAPDRVLVLERYANSAAFDDHLEDPENLRFNDELTPLISKEGVELTFIIDATEAAC